MSGRARLIVPPAESGTRVDAFIARSLPEVSRRAAKTMSRQGRVRRNGRVVAGSTTLDAGDVVELEQGAPEPAPAPQVQVLHRDSQFLYLHKPAGVHTVRLRPDDPPTLSDIACTLQPECGAASPNPGEGGALHRLDHGTSGVVAFARTPSAWAQGRASIGRAWKLYLARTCAPACPPEPSPHVTPSQPPPRWPPAATLPRPVAPGVETTWALRTVGARGHRMRVDPQGQPAASRVWPVDGKTLFAVRLLTGRRHQVRVHMASLGLALEGDPLYGTAPPGEHPRLHAWAMQLGPEHPVVVAPPPPWCHG